MQKRELMGVYMIRNTETGNCYIGSSKAIYHRRDSHLSSLKTGLAYNALYKSDFEKWGRNSFELVVLEIVHDPEKLVEREQVWLDKENPVYNTNKLAGKVVPDSARTPEARKRQADKIRGSKHTDEWKQMMSKRQKGENNDYWHKSPTHVIRNNNTGKVFSEETRKRMADNRRQIYHNLKSPEGVIYLDISNVSEFCVAHHLTLSHTLNLLHGKRTLYKGWTLEGNPSVNDRSYGPVQSPDGIIYNNILSLSAFAKEHDLKVPCLSQLVGGKIDWYKGWTKPVNVV